MSKPLLSIVITSYTMDRFKDICDLFDSIKAQTLLTQPQALSPQSDIGHLLEVIFVAERSRELYNKVKQKVAKGVLSPRSERFVTQDIGHRTLTFKVLWNDGEPGLSAARNLGILNSSGDIVAFVDDDIVLFPNWAKEVVKSFGDDSIIGVTGQAVPLWEDEKSMSWFPEEFYWIISCTVWFDCNERREVRNAWGMNMAFRREAFAKGELFSIDFGLRNSSRLGWIDPPSEDVDLSLRIKEKTGKKIIFNPNIKVRHRVYRRRIGLRFVIQRAASVGFQRRALKKLYPRLKSNGDLLSQEHKLLRRIFTRLFPGMLKDLVKNPAIACRKLSVAFVALLLVAFGYYFPLKRA